MYGSILVDSVGTELHGFRGAVSVFVVELVSLAIVYKLVYENGDSNRM